MTGIAIITAGREDAYQDYLQSVKEGHDPAEFEEYLSDSEVEAVTDSETGKVHLWGTSVDSKWQFVESGDIALIYREGRYIAQATVVRTREDLDLAEHLWRTEGNPWNPESPWKYSSPNPGAKTCSPPTVTSTNLCLPIRRCTNRVFTFSSNTISGILDCSRKVEPTTRTRFYRTSGRYIKQSGSDWLSLRLTYSPR